jgi:hypothetical protein
LIARWYLVGARIVFGKQEEHTDAPHSLFLLRLRVRSKQPSRRRTAYQLDEFPSPHVPRPRLEQSLKPNTLRSGCECEMR